MNHQRASWVLALVIVGWSAVITMQMLQGIEAQLLAGKVSWPAVGEALVDYSILVCVAVLAATAEAQSKRIATLEQRQTGRTGDVGAHAG